MCVCVEYPNTNLCPTSCLFWWRNHHTVFLVVAVRVGWGFTKSQGPESEASRASGVHWRFLQQDPLFFFGNLTPKRSKNRFTMERWYLKKIHTHTHNQSVRGAQVCRGAKVGIGCQPMIRFL